MGRNASGGGGSRARAAAANLGAISARAQARGRSSASVVNTRRAMSRRRGFEGDRARWDDNNAFYRSSRVTGSYRAGFETTRFNRRGGRNQTVSANRVRNPRGRFNVGRNRQLAAGQMTFLDF